MSNEMIGTITIIALVLSVIALGFSLLSLLEDLKTARTLKKMKDKIHEVD